MQNSRLGVDSKTPDAENEWATHCCAEADLPSTQPINKWSIDSFGFGTASDSYVIHKGPANVWIGR